MKSRIKYVLTYHDWSICDIRQKTFYSAAKLMKYIEDYGLVRYAVMSYDT